MQDISKRFPGVQALDHVSFFLHPGEVHALVGENGAGKSTLMKILSGVYQPDSGTIMFDRAPVNLTSPHQAQSLGISTIFQEFNLVPTLSVAENICLGDEPNLIGPFLVDWNARRQRARKALALLRADFDVDRPVEDLSVAQQQIVEIAKALERQARLVIMDEPTATLTGSETGTLFEVIHSLRQRGLGVIYISHRLEEITEIADRVTVLRDGQVVGTKAMEQVTLPDIVRMMIGREIDQQFPVPTRQRGRPVLSVRNLSRRGVLDNVSFDVYSGEILGLAGLVGSGRTDLAQVIFGVHPVDAGTIDVDGQPLSKASPVQAIRMGIGLAPEDRKNGGLVLSLPVSENITLASLDKLFSSPLIFHGREKLVAEKYVDELRIATPNVERETLTLSGGSQQKVVLSKWLLREAKTLILDEPTRGIDIGAKLEIYRLMDELASRGVAILMISSDLPEILGMSDRILVMHKGKIVGELDRDEATEERIMMLATGVNAND
jgi:ribose transport system ATP-binding protein